MKHSYIILAVLLLFTSCSKWLDVKPESQVDKNELFESEAGFQEALNGVYSRSTQSDLYGGELSFGFLDVLAQNYTIPNEDYQFLRHLQTSLFNYRDPDFIIRKDSVWRGLYNAITNCNIILENIDAKKNLFSGNNYSLIKGEALALRAYYHFDVLRMFAPSYVSNPSAPAIPYVTTFSNKVTPLSTVTETLNKIVEDLNAAKVLLKTSDPIATPAYIVGYPVEADETQTETKMSSLFLQNRRHRMNYYAVCASLARAYLYKDDKANALSNALEVINSKKFPWTSPADILSSDVKKKDRIFYKELVFAWYIPNMEDKLSRRFATGETGQFIEVNAGDALFEKGPGGVGGEDYRYKEWVRQVNTRLEVQKYLRDRNENLHYLVAPAIRLSEVWYIAAESTYDTDPAKGLAYIDSVRYHRGIGAPLSAPSKEVFLEELLKESRKEFYAEGQIFYTYKRLNRAIIGKNGATFPASDKIFVLPMPDNEIEFGGR